MRIAKFIAGSGICSRREAEQLILQGLVSIDGKIIDTPAINITNINIIQVKGKTIHYIDKPRLWIYYKPVGLITTHNDPQGRPTVFAALAHKLPRVISVGRLDINSEGLLMLTNSGEVSKYFESPKNQIARTYKVRAFGKSRPDVVRLLKMPMCAYYICL
ncbi:MAG: pseudouridine synthase [Rickettsiaceae bacterium]